VKILLLGQGVLAWQIVRALLATAAGQLVAVMPCHSCSEPAANSNLKQLLDKSSVLQLTAISARGTDFLNIVNKLQPDYVLLACWGEILTQPLLDTANTTFINCHPSLLPTHRGPNPYASVLQQHEAQTGVSFHIVDQGIDSGPLLLQDSLLIKSDDTVSSLRNRCAVLAGQMITPLLQLLANPDFQPVPQQKLGEPSYFPATTAGDERLNIIDLSSLERVCP